MSDDKHEQIKGRAYQIWEEQGRPEGQHHAHWEQASKELGHGVAPQAGTDPHPGMFGDGTEEQSLGQKGNPKARITEDEVKDAFASTPKAKQ